MAKSCTGTTKKGTPCKAPPINDTDRCVAHSPAEVRESLGFVARNGKGGRKRKPRPTDVSRELLEENPLVTERPYWRALGFDLDVKNGRVVLVAIPGGGAKVTAKHMGRVFSSEIEDLGAQIEAAEKLKDRTYGRPAQEVTVAGELPIHLEVTGAQIINDARARKHTRAARRRVGAARAELPRRARAGD